MLKLKRGNEVYFVIKLRCVCVCVSGGEAHAQ